VATDEQVKVAMALKLDVRHDTSSVVAAKSWTKLRLLFLIVLESRAQSVNVNLVQRSDSTSPWIQFEWRRQGSKGHCVRGPKKLCAA
jgi:hypothetical protein